MKVEAAFISMAHTLRPHGLESTQLLCPWDSPCQSTGVGAISSSRLPLWLSWWRICLQCRRPGFNPWVGKIPWRRERLPTPVVWHGEFKKSDTTERLSLSLSSSSGSSRFRNQTHVSWVLTPTLQADSSLLSYWGNPHTYICMYLFFFKLFSHLLQHIAQSSCWLCILSSSLLTLITGFSRQKRSLKTHSLPFNIILPRMWVLELLNVLFSLPSRGHQFTEPSNISVASFVPCLPPSGYYHIWQDGVQFHLKWWN